MRPWYIQVISLVLVLMRQRHHDSFSLVSAAPELYVVEMTLIRKLRLGNGLDKLYRRPRKTANPACTQRHQLTSKCRAISIHLYLEKSSKDNQRGTAHRGASTPPVTTTISASSGIRNTPKTERTSCCQSQSRGHHVIGGEASGKRASKGKSRASLQT